MSIAILAYGSLIDDPGSEFIITSRVTVTTPFPVEYARSSAKRAGGPTLVPVPYGNSVAAHLLILDACISLSEAKNMLWRRETGRRNGVYNPANPPTEKTVLIEVLTKFAQIETVLFTRIAQNIFPLTPDKLAELAIGSAANRDIQANEDGISYLLRTKKAGVITKLTNEYEAAICRQAGANSLEEALELNRYRKN